LRMTDKEFILYLYGLVQGWNDNGDDSYSRCAEAEVMAIQRRIEDHLDPNTEELAHLHE